MNGLKKVAKWVLRVPANRLVGRLDQPTSKEVLVSAIGYET